MLYYPIQCLRNAGMTEVLITTDGERTSSMDSVEQCSGSMNQAMAGQTIFLTDAAGFTLVRGQVCDRRVRRAAIATQDPDAVMDMSLEDRVERSIVDGTTGRTPGASARPRALEKRAAWYRDNESRRWLVKSVAHLESCEQQHGGR